MCGIAGVSRYNETTAPLIPMMAAMMESRGHDGFGITDGFSVRREIHRISKAYVLEPPPSGDWQYDKPLFLHTRGASIGKVALENTHPFLVDSEDGERWVLGCHNGNISNHAELMKKYPEFKYECDSNAIYKWMVEKEDLADVRGWGALVWFEGRYGEDSQGKVKRWVDSVVNMVKFNGATLWASTLETGEILWGSTEEVVSVPATMYGLRLVEKPAQIWNEYRYRLKLSDDPELVDTLERGEQMQFGMRAPIITPGYSSNNDSWQDWRTRHANQGFRANSYVACGERSGDSSKVVVINKNDKLDGYVAADFNKIGKHAREHGLCVSCYKEVINRAQESVCIDCLFDRMFDARKSLRGEGKSRIIIYDQVWGKGYSTAEERQGRTPSRECADSPWVVAVGTEAINRVIEEIKSDVRGAVESAARTPEITRVDVGGSTEVPGGVSSCNVTASEDSGKQQQADVATPKD